jgi:hypothetical protein
MLSHFALHINSNPQKYRRRSPCLHFREEESMAARPPLGHNSRFPRSHIVVVIRYPASCISQLPIPLTFTIPSYPITIPSCLLLPLIFLLASFPVVLLQPIIHPTFPFYPYAFHPDESRVASRVWYSQIPIHITSYVEYADSFILGFFPHHS